VNAASDTPPGSAPGRRRRQAAALATCHLLLFVVLPVAHAVLPIHDSSAGAHACPLCQSLQRGIDALPAGNIGAVEAAPLAASHAERPTVSILSDDNHDPAAPRAPPLA
jgi:hypothetical protein